MEDIIFCKSGGCSAKLGAKALDSVLSKLTKKEDENLLVGFDHSDDAAIYKVNDELAIVSTLDFFPPMVEDPSVFGQIADCNAMSDVYAMGGEVKTCLNIVCFPEKLDMNILGKILQGGNDKVLEAGGILVGGHSINDEDIKYGMSVTGFVNPSKIYTNNGIQFGDALILTKPLGVGIVMAANRVKAASRDALKKATDSMTTLNKYAADILKDYDVHGCTDVTGFGFLVHLSEMLSGKYSALVYHEDIPYIKECKGYIEEFYLTGAAQKNRNFMDGKVLFKHKDFIMEEILFDPQTSGGLLFSVKREDAKEIVEKMNQSNIPACIVGEIINKKEYDVEVI